MNKLKKKYIKGIINTPNWTEKQISKMGPLMQIDIRDTLAKKKLFKELYGNIR